MTHRTPLQGDLLLDIFEQCQTVSALYEQKEEAQQTGDDDDVKEVTKLYDKACERLGDLCGDADVHGVAEADITKLCYEQLPEHLSLGTISLAS